MSAGFTGNLPPLVRAERQRSGVVKLRIADHAEADFTAAQWAAFLNDCAAELAAFTREQEKIHAAASR